MTDRGPGLSDDDVDWLFERFTHGEADGRPRGSGLGLAIVTAVATAHGGELRLSANPDGGLTAVLELPVGGPEDDSGAAGSND